MGDSAQGLLTGSSDHICLEKQRVKKAQIKVKRLADLKEQISWEEKWIKARLLIIIVKY